MLIGFIVSELMCHECVHFVLHKYDCNVQCSGDCFFLVALQTSEDPPPQKVV